MSAKRPLMPLVVGASASSGSRLISGNMTVHRRLESRLAEFKGTDAALLFGSGYMANTGIIPALSQEGEVIFSDELNHASIVDGCRLSRAETFIYDHGDLEHLAWGLRQTRGRASLIVTDSVFSMDGDIAPLEGIVELAHNHDVRVMVDEAHATGTVGPEAAARSHALGLTGEIDVIVGTLGKALGAYGAFAACDTRWRATSSTPHAVHLQHRAGAAVVAAALEALELLIEQPRRVTRLRQNAELPRRTRPRGLRRLGRRRTSCRSSSATPQLAMKMSRRRSSAECSRRRSARRRCPTGTSRLRLAVMATHSRDELREAARVLGRAALQAGFRPGDGRRWRPAREAATPPGGRGLSARPVRHGHGHRRGQDGRRRGDRAALDAAGGASRRSSRSSPASTSPSRAAARPRAARPRRPAGAPGTSARYVRARRSRRTSLPSWPDGGRAGGARRGAARGRRRRRRRRRRGRRWPARRRHARLPGARLRCSTSGSRCDRRATRSRHDQPHAAHRRRRRAGGLECRRRAHAVAARPGRDRASNRDTIAALGAVEVAVLPVVGTATAELAAAGATLPLERWIPA